LDHPGAFTAICAGWSGRFAIRESSLVTNGGAGSSGGWTYQVVGEGGGFISSHPVWLGGWVVSGVVGGCLVVGWGFLCIESERERTWGLGLLYVQEYGTGYGGVSEDYVG
jgi:hypothetical protein